eukprot:scaffold48636_cov21-Tisochrysis_lutea.AAC.2
MATSMTGSGSRVLCMGLAHTSGHQVSGMMANGRWVYYVHLERQKPSCFIRTVQMLQEQLCATLFGILKEEIVSPVVAAPAQDGRREGIGVKRYADGSTFDGFWKNGKKHGVGVFRPAQPADKFFLKCTFPFSPTGTRVQSPNTHTAQHSKCIHAYAFHQASPLVAGECTSPLSCTYVQAPQHSYGKAGSLQQNMKRPDKEAPRGSLSMQRSSPHAEGSPPPHLQQQQQQQQQQGRHKQWGSEKRMSIGSAIHFDVQPASHPEVNGNGGVAHHVAESSSVHAQSVTASQTSGGLLLPPNWQLPKYGGAFLCEVRRVHSLCASEIQCTGAQSQLFEAIFLSVCGDWEAWHASMIECC